MPRRAVAAGLFLLLALSRVAFAAEPPGVQEQIATQRKALEPLAIFDGTWRGSAKVYLPGGKVLDLVQTERVGPFLGGTVRLIEGRGFAADGTMPFNAFGIISFSPRTRKYNFRAYAQGQEGDFPLEVRPDGFTWTVNAGPASIRYTATVKDDTWTEVGEAQVEGKGSVRTFEMTLRRTGNTAWPQDGAPGPGDVPSR